MFTFAYTVLLVGACASWPPASGFGGVKVKKCCPRDTILKIDMSSCTEYVPGDQNDRESYGWSSDSESDPDSGEVISSTLVDDIKLSLANSTTVPWWVPYEMEFLRASNLSMAFKPDLVSFDADGRMPCNAMEREVTIIDDDVAVLDDGRLIIFGQENRTTGSHQRLTFSSAEYCIDRVSLLDNITFPGGRKKDDHRHNVATAAPAANLSATAVLTYTYVALVCRPCSRITCVPKCCAKGYMLEYQKNKVLGCRRSLSVANANAAIHLKAANGTQLTRKDFYFFGMKPPDCGGRNWYLLNKSRSDRGPLDYGLLPDGRVQVDEGLVPIERDEYCVDAMNVVPDTPVAAGTPPTYTDALLACRLDGGAAAKATGLDTAAADIDGPLEFREILYGTYFVVGTAFLAATLLIYAVLPELRVTVHSGNLIAHTVCLFVSYATLAATTLVRHAFNTGACIFAGFLIQFSFLAAFFWLNVMCADIAWTFSGFRLLLYSNKIENEKKKYIIYSIYAWGCSIGITVLTALAEFTEIFGDCLDIKPNFGRKGCWFSNKPSVGVFFYLPIGILLLTNFLLFLFTAFRIVFIRRDTSKVLNRQTNQNKIRLSLYLKLFCLMGVTFVFEVISWAVQVPPYYWYATDAVNSLRGVFVFFIFCWKRSVMNLLLARAPESARKRFVRTFGLRDTHRYPSFSSSCHPNMHSCRTSSARTHSTSTRNAATGSGSIQLSQFSSSASIVAGGPGAAKGTTTTMAGARQ
ncbi:G-protein coupled receptor Mth-like [Sipha flava]|uniref:G-protein coupled receptor Mth-like n=1 Tax=Sipha flava TaxID=143950 RepID=A0A8B8FI77_9HEMI|nr:G-protein coupled receptor Mth-like [Sipha flava]XP_025410051.1 G-protein coupled receptor Mth-like [Sipha flava]XP_025410052.1 G-protein coupled receptor Mth-like [Sipha flava]XP_025410053.1 G-protein coupled receptor Mth-like [Sipha flava]XP_025410054.1 G-protein coupled receptor Mth-like [Sipha flava]XP_025410055.1 G-protein coupled receptor Mth-like [Sipha flava]XP_025410056.1 G-protein coupled receptor Mth-like [Sipha flava]XP_025410057.1 G-protein coupled receptor Mth-like [Sipha fl